MSRSPSFTVKELGEKPDAEMVSFTAFAGISLALIGSEALGISMGPDADGSAEPAVSADGEDELDVMGAAGEKLPFIPK